MRSNGDPLSLAPTVRQVVRELEPGAPLSNVATVSSLVDQSLLRPQSLSLLVASFAGVALLLSIIGIYGVMGYYVQQHLKEISIRMALGGSRGDVARLVVGQGMTVVVVGVIVGTALAFAATRLMSSLLFGVGAADPRDLHRRRGADGDGRAAGVRAAGLARDARPAGGGVAKRIGPPSRGCLSSRQSFFLDQHSPENLSGRRLRNRVDEVHVLDALVVRDLRLRGRPSPLPRSDGSRLTTIAFGTSPQCSSATGITATSAICGCFSSNDSSSAGATWKPLTLISSFNRSTTVR